MRSARQFKVSSSKFEVVETKPTDPMWAKRDRPRPGSKGKHHENYQTNPFQNEAILILPPFASFETRVCEKHSNNY